MLFGAYIEGFKYCRLVINIDVTYLYGRYDEKLLITVAFDANNRIFSLSFAIVDEENSFKWRWFLLCLQKYVTSDRTSICIISDKHASIKNRVAKI